MEKWLEITARLRKGLEMAELTIKEMECLQRGLGIIEGVAACGVSENVAGMLIAAVEMIETGLMGGSGNG